MTLPHFVINTEAPQQTISRFGTGDAELVLDLSPFRSRIEDDLQGAKGMKNKKTAAILLIIGVFAFCLCVTGLGPASVSAESSSKLTPQSKRRKDDKISETLRAPNNGTS